MSVALSVIVPVFNGADVILRSVNSILAAAVPDIELIVVNDGSADDTSAVLNGIADERVHIIKQKNMGQGFARNTALEMARGEYVAFVDADDTVSPDMFSKMLQRARETGADVVQCNILDIFPDGTQREQLTQKDKTAYITDRGSYMDKYFSTCRHSYEVCNKLIRRDVIEEHNLRFGDTRKYFSEDLLFNLRLIEHIKSISFINEPYYNYYQNDKSHFHSDAEKRLRGLYALFHDYIDTADKDMAYAASYTAAMVLLYSMGACASSGAAAEILRAPFFKSCLRTALTRHCKIKHRLFLTAELTLPYNVKTALTRMYSGRWSR